MILRMKREEHYKRIDKIERGSELIYRQQLNYSLNVCKLFPVVSMGGTALLVAYKYLLADIFENHSDALDEIMLDASDLWPCLVGFYVFNMLLFICVNRIPLRIYRTGDEYVAIIPGLLPTNNPKITFKKGELVEDFIGKLTFRGVSFKLKDRKFFLFPQRFRRPSDLYSILPETQSAQYVKSG